MDKKEQKSFWLFCSFCLYKGVFKGVFGNGWKGREMLQIFFNFFKKFLKKVLQNQKKYSKIEEKWSEVEQNTHKVERNF